MLPSPLWSSGHLSRTPRAHLCAEAQQQQPRNHAELPALMSKHLPWVAGVAGAATVPRPLASAHTGPRDCRELSHLGYGQDMVTCVGPQGHSCLHLGILSSQVFNSEGRPGAPAWPSCAPGADFAMAQEKAVRMGPLPPGEERVWWVRQYRVAVRMEAGDSGLGITGP